MGGGNGSFSSGGAHRIGGGDVHVLAYTSSLEEHRLLAQMRRRQVEESAFYDEQKDSIFVLEVDDLGMLKSEVAKCAAYGKIAEFSLWSHGALDGPIGETATSRSGSCSAEQNDLPKQLTLDEWAGIDFNWNPAYSFAAFYACRSAIGRKGQPYSETAFAYKFLELHPDLVASAGQPWFQYISRYPHILKSPAIGGFAETDSIYGVSARSMIEEDGSRDWSYVMEAVDSRIGDGIPAIKMRIFYRGEEAGMPKVLQKRDYANITSAAVLLLEA